jgi:hypothetical protein
MSLWGVFCVCHGPCVGSFCADRQLPGEICFTASQGHKVARLKLHIKPTGGENFTIKRYLPDKH